MTSNKRKLVCPACGHNNPLDHTYCSKCGQALEAKSADETERSASTGPQSDKTSKKGLSPVVKFVIVLGVIVVVFSIALAVVGVVVISSANRGQQVSVPPEEKPAPAPVPKEESLSKPQEQIVDAIGPPKQFILAFTPVGNEASATLIRNEVWFYPEHKKKINFIGGKIFSTGETKDPGVRTSYSGLKPQDFDFSMDYEQVVKAIGNSEVKPVKFANDLFEQDGVKSYLVGKVIFTIEKEHLVYLQTVGVKK